MTTTIITIDERDAAELYEEALERLRNSTKTHQPAQLGPSLAAVLLVALDAGAKVRAELAEAKRESAERFGRLRAAEHVAANLREHHAADVADLRQRLDEAQARLLDLERQNAWREVQTVQAEKDRAVLASALRVPEHVRYVLAWLTKNDDPETFARGHAHADAWRGGHDHIGVDRATKLAVRALLAPTQEADRG